MMQTMEGTPTVRPDNGNADVAGIVNPAGDRDRTQPFADWNLEPTMPTEVVTPSPEPGQAAPTAPPEPAPAPPVEAEPRAAETPVTPAAPEEDPLAGLLSKYPTREAAVKAYRELQRLQTVQGQELGDLRKQLAERLELVDEFFETGDDGRLVLRTEKALERAQTAQPQPQAIDERVALQQEILDERKYLLEEVGIDPADLETALRKAEPRIMQRVKLRMEASARERQEQFIMQAARAGRMLDQFWSENPDYATDEIKRSVASWYERFPRDVRAELILSGVLPLKEIAHVEHIRHNFEVAVRKAFELGKSMAAQSVVPPAASGPSPGVRAPETQKGMTGSDAEFKAGLIQAGVLPSIFRD